jgi:hypothetical protein
VPNFRRSRGDNFKIELVRKLFEASEIDGEITECNITIRKVSPFNFDFRKLLTLKGNHEGKN